MSVVTTDRLERYMKGLVAAADLATRAARDGFFVEYVVLTASLIDGVLRIGLVLQNQLRSRSSAIDEALLYQAATDPILSERSVYRRALEEGVIKQEVFDRLQELYDQRNRVVHRYLITDLTTAEVVGIARALQEGFSLVSDAVAMLEQRQLDEGVGMTCALDGTLCAEELREFAKEKHGSEWLARALSRGAT